MPENCATTSIEIIVWRRKKVEIMFKIKHYNHTLSWDTEYLWTSGKILDCSISGLVSYVAYDFLCWTERREVF